MIFNFMICIDGQHRWETRSNEDRQHYHLPSRRPLPPTGTMAEAWDWQLGSQDDNRYRRWGLLHHPPSYHLVRETCVGRQEIPLPGIFAELGGDFIIDSHKCNK